MINEQVLISVIVPIYNVENYVEACILSIINQTHKNLQILLIDDGSTDRSGEICDNYEKKDQRIEVIHQKNSGLVRARKKGLEKSRGQYIGFVDGDDYIDENMYADMLKDILSSQADFVHTGFFYGDEKSKQLDDVNKLYDIRNIKTQFLRNYVMNQGQNCNISYSIWSKLFKRDLIIKCYQKVPDTQSYGEDMLALCACIMESNSIYIEEKTYYHYVYRSDSMTRKDWTTKVICLGKLYECMRNLLEEYNVYHELRASLDRWFQICIINHISSQKEVHFYIHRYFYPDILSLKGKKIIIYGAGTVGRDYYAQFCQYRRCEMVAWVDKSALKYKNDCVDILEPDKIKNMFYDKIVIAVKKYQVAEQIKRELSEKGIEKDKMIWLVPQYLI